MLLRRYCLLQRVVDNEIQKQVVPAQHAADFAAALQVNEQLFVHELDRPTRR